MQMLAHTLEIPCQCQNKSNTTIIDFIVGVAPGANHDHGLSGICPRSLYDAIDIATRSDLSSAFIAVVLNADLEALSLQDVDQRCISSTLVRSSCSRGSFSEYSVSGNADKAATSCL